MATIQKKLKEAFPSRTNAKPFSKPEIKTYEKFQKERVLNLTDEHIKYVCELFHKTFKWKKEGKKEITLGNVWYPEVPLTSASNKVIYGMVTKLDIVFKAMK